MAKVERTYNHLLYRVDYPAERGYRMEPKQLPPWVHICISEEGNSKWLTVHSRIHVNKVVKIYPIYNSEFSDRDIIKDLSAKVSRMFLRGKPNVQKLRTPAH